MDTPEPSLKIFGFEFNTVIKLGGFLMVTSLVALYQLTDGGRESTHLILQQVLISAALVFFVLFTRKKALENAKELVN